MKNNNKTSKYKYNQIGNKLAINTFIVNIIKNCIKYRNKYLLYNMAKMLLYIFILLLVIFFFIPHKAYVVLESDDVNYLHINSDENANCYIYSSNLTRLDVQLMKNGKFILHLGNVKIENDGEIYTGDFEIIFGYEEENINNSYEVHFEPVNNAYVNVEIFNLENLQLSHQEKPNIVPTTGPVAGLTTYLTTNGDVMINNSFSIVILDKEYVSAYIVNKDNKEIPLGEECNIFFYDSYANIDFLQGEFAIIEWHGTNAKSKFSISSICDMDINCNGDLYFSYIPESTKYKVYFQDISLQSKNNNISCEYTFDFESDYQKILVNGNTNKAYLSGNNLFPNLIGWYKTNIYMIPLTLISTVIGGLALTYNKKKVEE